MKRAPHITGKQIEILRLLYTYRFLHRIQLQQFLRHKDYKTINLWLRDLTAKQYVHRIYSTHFLERTKPAVYYLNTQAIRYLKNLRSPEDDEPLYEIEQLRKRYKDGQRSTMFIDRCLLIADCQLRLMHASSSLSSTYTGIVQADYLDERSDYNFLCDLDTLRPDMLIVQRTGEDITAHYLLQFIDPHVPQKRIRAIINGYFTVLNNYQWYGDDPLPTVLLVLPDTYTLIYTKRRIRQLIREANIYVDDATDDTHIRCTTQQHLKEQGITATIWEEGRTVYGL
ncbi:MAG TPA: hypothetical protein VFN56_03515 [Candidatus Saccharimonadales bacterium]|nr:hypothetical protein [Candidatus Saccharimonadales bacterium]